MPIYEYRCAACSKRSSSLLKSFSSPDPVCPHCGKSELRRLVSSFATVHSGDEGGDGEDGHDHGEFGAGDDSGDGDDDFGGGGGGGGGGGFDDDDY